LLFSAANLAARSLQDLLLERADLCIAHAVNLCEVYYKFNRAGGEAAAQAALDELETVGVNVRQDMDRELWQEAGRLKATLKRIALADCFALALAKREAGTVVTSDHHEFDPIALAGHCPVKFIR
jgi:predicted nucleic acid-binding protein